MKIIIYMNGVQIMANYTVKELEDLLKIAGFVYTVSNNGSHQSYVHTKTGIENPLPIHGKDLNSGNTAESIISYVIYASYVAGDDIENNKKVSPAIRNYIKKKKKNIEKNILNVFPTTYRRNHILETETEARNHIEEIRRHNGIIVEQTGPSM